MELVTDPVGKIDLSTTLDSCKLIVFKQTLVGIESIGKNLSLPFPSNRPRSDIEKLASFFSIALGQGDSYNQGLYGPLPALNSAYEALIFAKLVPDKEKFDPRMKGLNYVFFCFFYPKMMEFLINSRRFRFSAEIMTFLTDLNDVGQIKVCKIKELEKRLKYALV
ncbi:MAG: hypothetical protein ACXAEU_02780 [Candidatus Hodarchaeales archaeon]